jgi:RNA polymerase sigma-70 factor (ECF subfamily)
MLHEKDFPEQTILYWLSQDSQPAFAQVFETYRNRIYQTALFYLKSPAMAEEVVQDTFMKLWFQRHHLQQVQCLEAWLYTVARNLTIDYLKKIAREKKLGEKLAALPPMGNGATDALVQEHELSNLFQSALQQLSAQQRQVYQLARNEGLHYDEIGKQLNISPLTVKTHMARALATIRAVLRQHGYLSLCPLFWI